MTAPILIETHEDWQAEVERDQIGPDLSDPYYDAAQDDLKAGGAAYRAAFVCDSPEKLAWVLRRAQAVRGQIDEVTDWVEREIATLRAHLEAETAPDRRSLAFFEALARDYAMTQPWPEGRTTVNHQAPTGKVTRRRMELQVKVVDEAAAIKWCDANRPIAVDRIPTLRWSALKPSVIIHSDGVYSGDGEKVPGLEVEERPDKVEVQIDG